MGIEDLDKLAGVGAPVVRSSSDHPRYPGMGLTQILAVRDLEKHGMSHEDAVAAVQRMTQWTPRIPEGPGPKDSDSRQATGEAGGSARGAQEGGAGPDPQPPMIEEPDPFDDA